MKIGIDGRALKEKKSGVGVYVYEILRYLNDNDTKNEYYIYSDKKVYIDFKLNDNFKICDNLAVNNKIGTVWFYYSMPKIIFKDNIEIFWGTFHTLPKRNKYTKNIKYIMNVHDIALLKIKNTAQLTNIIMHKLFFKKSCINADKIMAISKSTKNDLCDMFNIDSSKIIVTYLAGNKKKDDLKLTAKDIKEIENKYDLSNSKFLFFLSTIEPRKNIITLVKAFEKLKENNKDLKLILAGGLGWKYKKIVDKINSSKYKEDIIMPGYITNLEKKYFFEKAICFVYPSLYEGFGIPVLEAMSNNQIVVTSNNSSLPEVGGKAAYYYDEVYSYDNLAKVIEKVINLSEKERIKKINEGLEQVKKFSWEKTGEEIKNILLEK